MTRPFSQLLLAVALLGAACREPISVYDAPKEPVQEAAAPAPPSGAPQMPMPDLKWADTPENWEEIKGGSSMRVATFRVTGPDNAIAELRAIPIPGRGMKEIQLVNMWREQIGLKAVTDAEFADMSEPVEAGGSSGTMFDIASGKEKGQERILVAVVWNMGFTWFFKFQGDATLIESEKSKFANFLKGLEFQTKMPQMSAAPSGAANRPAPARPEWKTPAHWEDLGAGMMQLAKYRAAGEGGETQISVSRLGGPAGGVPANVNRWRGQVGLSSVSAADANASAKPFEVPTGDAKIVDLSGTTKDMLVIMVAQGGSTWFFKSMGTKAAVERERAAFVEFVKSVQY